MGNCCSTPQPIPPKPAPRSGEPIQLLNQIEIARNQLRVLTEKLPLLKARLGDIPLKIESNKEVIRQIVEGLTPIDDEIQSKLPEDSDAETTVCAEHKSELMALVAIADTFAGQKRPATAVDSEVATEVHEVAALLATLNDLMEKAANYPDELSQVKDLLEKCNALKLEVATVEPVAGDTKKKATSQEDEYLPIREKLNRYASIEEVVEEMNYEEAPQEQEVAADIIDDFAGVEEFFDEGVYSVWLCENSVLMKAYKKYNQPEFEKADLRTVVITFERLMLEKAEADARATSEGLRPLDLDYYVLSSFMTSDAGVRGLCSFVSGLLDAAQNGRYPEIIARILGLHDKNSLAPSWAGSIPEIMKRFDKLFSFLKVSKAVISRMNEESGEETVNDVLSGGDIKLNLVVNELFSSFENNPTFGVSWMRRLKPTSISEENYLLYLLCNRMKSVNTDSNKLFQDLTAEKNLEMRDFAAGLKKKFNLMLTEEEFQILFDRIDRTHSGAIPRVCFTQEVKLSWYYQINSKSDFTVSKCQVLGVFLALGQEYMKTVAWQTYLATKTLRVATFDYLTSSFGEVATAMEISDPSEVLAKIHETSGRPVEERFSIDDLVRYALRRPFGFLSQYAVCKLYTAGAVTLPHADLPDDVKTLVEALQ